MLSVSESIIAAGIFLPLLVVVKTFFQEKKNASLTVLHVLFQFLILAQVVYFFSAQNILTGSPHLLRVFYPIALLSPLLFYLYVYITLHNKLNRYLIGYLLLSTGLVYINYIPIYTLDINSKVAIITSLTKPSDILTQTQGYIPEAVISLFRIANSVFFLGLTVSAIAGNTTLNQNQPGYRRVLWWLLTFSTLTAVSLVIESVSIIEFTFLTSQFVASNQVLVTSIWASCWLGISVYKLLEPYASAEITQYGASTYYQATGKTFTDQSEGIQKDAIDQYLRDQSCSDPTFSRLNIAAYFGLTLEALTQIIDNLYALKVNDLINTFRAKEMASRILAGDLEKMSVETLASECAFNNIGTAYKAFKLETGTTPAKFEKDRRS
jgi:AraC-like DNA-binding protein